MAKEKEIMSEETEIIETEPNVNEKKEIIPGEEVGISDKYLAHLDFVASNIDRFITAKQKIWQAILRLAKPGDWVVFETEDKNSPTGKRSTACLSGAGADRIASSIGISFTNWSEKKETGEDRRGSWYRYWFEVDASFGGRTVRVMGRASSRDKFFGMAYGQLKEISEIDEGEIKVAAYHNAMKEGVKILLGLRNIPQEEFEKAGLQLIYARRIEFKKPQVSNGVVKPNPEEIYCSACGDPITKAEKDFSLKNFNVVFCRSCQNSRRGRNDYREN